MKKILTALLLALSFRAAAASIDGIVKTPAGEPVPGMTVSLTLLPIDDAEDVTATTSSGRDGRFHFADVKPGRYAVAASSATTCAGAAATDATAEAVITAATDCRTITGLVTGATGAHVLAGRFHEGGADLYSAPIRDGRYTIALPAGGTVVVQALAPGFLSPETIVAATGDINLTLERRYAAMPPEARRWIAANAIAVPAGTPLPLAPLRKLVGDARIVALGEATHGTREFFQFKHRMLEFLVANMGFNLFAIEASEPDAMAIDDYVLTGKGDPAAALANLGFWTWNTEEVLDMIRWMRTWNEDPSHKTKVRFYGFDMQNPAAAQRRLKNWLTEKLPDALPLLERKANSELAAKLDAYAPHDAAWATARHMLELLEQSARMGKGANAEVRDRAMAENIEWILAHEAPKSRMVVWAHNGHVSAEPLPFAPGGTTGVHLRKAFGRELLVAGFAFDHGAFRAVDRKKGLIEQHAAPLDESSFDHSLAIAGPPMFLLDLRSARGATRDWLDAPLPMRSIGAVYDEATPKSYVARIHPLRSFDALFFVNETTAARQVRAPRPKTIPAPVNLSFDEGLAGWTLSPQSIEAGYVVSAKTDGCVSGGCAVVSIADRKTDGTGVFAQRIDAAPFRGKKIRLRAKMKSTMTGDGSARIWLRVDRPDGPGFLDTMADRAPHSLPDWTDLEITGDVAPDADVIAFGLFMTGDGTAWIDSVTLE